LIGTTVVRLGFRPLMVGGALCYVAGLVALRSYDLAVKIGVGLGLVAGTLQIMFAAPPPSRQPPRLGLSAAP
jgi:hypothetical protein